MNPNIDCEYARGTVTTVNETALVLLDESWHLKPIEVEHPEDVLERAEGFSARLEAAGIKARAFLDAFAKLSFAEKFALVDQAEQVHNGGAAGEPRNEE